MNVLLVDDEVNTRSVYRQLLELAGHEVVTAESAEAATQAIDHSVFDVAFIDLVLGGADGFSVLQYLKQRQPGTRAVMVTAHDIPDASDRALALRAETLLAKPVRWDDMRTFLNAALETNPDGQ